jgi:hypothetical protein
VIANDVGEDHLTEDDLAQARAVLSSLMSTQLGRGPESSPETALNVTTLVDAILTTRDPRASALLIVSEALAKQVKNGIGSSTHV